MLGWLNKLKNSQATKKQFENANGGHVEGEISQLG